MEPEAAAVTPRDRGYKVLRLVAGRWKPWGRAMGPDAATALRDWLRTAQQEHRAAEFKLEGAK